MSNYSESINPPNIVTLILDNIRLERVTNQVIAAIKEIGAYEDKIQGKTVWIIDFSNDSELANKLHELNELGFLFVGGPAGWPPAEVFDDLREKKLVVDNFKEVRWRGPGDWFIIKR